MTAADVGAREKQKEIKKMYRAAHAEGKKKVNDIYTEI